MAWNVSGISIYLYMKNQDEIQSSMTFLIKEMSKRNVENKDRPIPEVLKEHPDIKEKWDVLMKEAEELRSAGKWISK